MVEQSIEGSQRIKMRGKGRVNCVAFVFCPQIRVSGAQMCAEILTLGPWFGPEINTLAAFLGPHLY